MIAPYQDRLSEILTRYTQELSRLDNYGMVEGIEAGITSYTNCVAAINALNGEMIGEDEMPKGFRGIGTPGGQRDAFRSDLRRRFGVES